MVALTISKARVSFWSTFTPNSFFASMLPRTWWVGHPTDFVLGRGKP